MGCFDADEKISGYLCRPALAIPCVFQKKDWGGVQRAIIPQWGLMRSVPFRWRRLQKRTVPCFCE